MPPVVLDDYTAIRFFDGLLRDRPQRRAHDISRVYVNRVL